MRLRSKEQSIDIGDHNASVRSAAPVEEDSLDKLVSEEMREANEELNKSSLSEIKAKGQADKIGSKVETEIKNLAKPNETKSKIVSEEIENELSESAIIDGPTLADEEESEEFEPVDLEDGDNEIKEISDFLEDDSDRAEDQIVQVVDENASTPSNQKITKADDLEDTSEAQSENSEDQSEDVDVFGGVSTQENEDITPSHEASKNTEELEAENQETIDDDKTKTELAELAKEEGLEIEREESSLENDMRTQYKESLKAAIKDNQDVATIPVIVIDENGNTAKVDTVNVNEFQTEMLNGESFLNSPSESAKTKSVEEILGNSMDTNTGKSNFTAKEGGDLFGDVGSKVTEHETDTELKMKGLDATEEKKIGGIPTSEMTGNKDFKDFEAVTIEEAITNPNHKAQKHHKKNLYSRMHRGEQIQSTGAISQEHYVSNHSKKMADLKIRAESEALIRTEYKIPKGMPDVIFMSDYFNVSGVGEHRPPMTMTNYYGHQSEFHKHFSEKAEKQISFEDIDTLIGLVSDINGIFNGIFKLLPSKEEIEEESSSKLGKINSALDKAYDILRFYSRLRSFVNTVVYERHLIVQDLQLLRSKVDFLQTDEEDMLRFYALERQHLKVKTRGLMFDYDPKIKMFMKNIDGISVQFGSDVKTILRTVFKLEKAIVFFDSDIRSLARGVNTENPIEVLKTIDSVMMLLIRIMEVKIDILKSADEVKKALKGIVKHRVNIVGNLEGAEQLIHYYKMQKEGVAMWGGAKAQILMMVVLIWGVVGRVSD